MSSTGAVLINVWNAEDSEEPGDPSERGTDPTARRRYRRRAPGTKRFVALHELVASPEPMSLEQVADLLNRRIEDVNPTSYL